MVFDFLWVKLTELEQKTQHADFVLKTVDNFYPVMGFVQHFDSDIVEWIEASSDLKWYCEFKKPFEDRL